MAQFSMRVLVVKRSKGQSVIASAAYRAGEKLWDERQGIAHDFRHKSTGVEHKEMLFPDTAPAWVRGIDREAFWNAVDASELRKDAQTARDLRIMIPREIPVAERVPLVRDFVIRNFVSKGMVADVCWHNTTASDGLEQPHCHVLLSMRPLSDEGFGPKSRHEYIPDPSGQTHKDGRPVMIESNPDSWNSAHYYERCREGWEQTANAALERVGSAARIDRRSLLERGLARMPEPALRLAFHLKELRGVMQTRWGTFQMARHYRAVEARAGAVFRVLDGPATLSVLAPREAGSAPDAPERAPPRQHESPAQKVERFIAWFERQIERLSPAAPAQAHTRAHGAPAPERGSPRSPPTPDMER
ncbi:MobQ family relaxase [Novosphingobium sp.]|uniref:MobQ family relaxase n=1 Tax=Novosphingobium sp. TaxID=1874826 RepID=UPI0038B79DFC